MKSRLDIVTIGSSLRDVLFYTDRFEIHEDTSGIRRMCIEHGSKVNSEEVHFEYGGGAGNTAINARGLGLRVGIIAGVGDDLDGRAISTHLRSQGVDVRCLHVSKTLRTGFSFVQIDKYTGEHTAFVFYGAAREIIVPPALLKHPPRWFYVSSLNVPGWKTVLKTVFGSLDAAIAWNPGAQQIHAGLPALRKFLRRTNVFIVNESEALQLTGARQASSRSETISHMLQHIHSYGPGIVVITAGKNGSYAYDGSSLYFEPTSQKKPKDTTGAGDCYGSSFVVGLIRFRGDVRLSMLLAARNATELVQVIGAQNGLLQWKDVPQSLRSAATKQITKKQNKE